MADTNTNNGKSVSSNSQGYIFLYIFIAILIIAALIFMLKSSFFDKRSVDARILKDEMYLNEDLVFTDNTRSAKKWLWEFGNGAKLTTQNGSYRYNKAGSYIIRLTVDGELKEQFPVTVRDTVIAALDTMVTISGPTSGVVNEEVRVEAEGKANQFEWSFGETNRVDVKGRTALYTFHTPGKFMVKLTTDRSHRPIYHTIFITDPNAEIDNDMIVPGEGEQKVIDDIRARLQAIANGADFNSNYYYLIRRYMCTMKSLVAVDKDGLRNRVIFILTVWD